MNKKDNIGELLSGILPIERIKTRYIDRVTYGSDAGFYYLLPRAVVNPVTEEEVVRLFAFSHQHKIPLVFRAGGTSLSGQSITNGILVDIARGWGRVQIEEEGRFVRVQPGITGAMVNARLARHGRKIGPDPSSISSAMMGGILSNNSSGMCCGVVNNAYHTTRGIRMVLPNGKIFDTGVAGDHERLATECPELAGELLALRGEILGNPALYEKIRKKYRTKNTVGYSLNAFIDHEHPLDILAHLLIGGEGTLGFIAEAVLETLPVYPCRATALLYYTDLYTACADIGGLREAGAEAVELMDRASLRAVEDIAGMPDVIKGLPVGAAALLVEFQEASVESLQERIGRFVPGAGLLYPPVFSTDVKQQDLFWKVRKGLFPSVGAVRKSGTTVILEDIAFPVEKLGDALTDLRVLFDEYGYEDGIIFGHAKDGNIHFVITQSFHSREDIDRYDRFIQKMVKLVVERYDGSLKGEHGTGRNMAPFVEVEWGSEAYAIMCRLKRCVDPENLLNPCVILSSDDKLHVRDLKQMPVVEQEVDKCIECGYCEHVCPSRDVTMTPRRRIVARRVLQLAKQDEDWERHDMLLKEYRYDGMDTCAVDGLCATACPVDINTGDLVKRLRRESHSRWGNKVALYVARNLGMVEGLVRMGLRVGVGINRVFGARAMTRLTRGVRRVIPAMPVWSEGLGVAGSFGRTVGSSHTGQRGQLVYFPSCVSRVMRQEGQDRSGVIGALSRVSSRVGLEVIIPEDVKGACCGQLFSSKGFTDAFRWTCRKTVEQLWEVTRQGELPVVTDVSSCAYTMLHFRDLLDEEGKKKYDKLRIMDIVDCLHDLVLPLAGGIAGKEDVVLHPVCSLAKMGTYGKLIKVAKHFARGVTVPMQAGCCGMAGDRGFLFPELTHGATYKEAQEVNGRSYDGYYSSAVTCEMALSQATGKTYESLIYLVDRAMGE
ncbi:MAG TPA: FAD-binding and (Fe-S)-binding domain-containing protein [Puia sp.]|nr:FAD-binding and (Fe-S)-binding domain-containing protein [Puia sp.]